MATYSEFTVPTEGENFYNIAPMVDEALEAYFQQNPASATSGVLYLFCTHTSCGLTINEGFDPSAIDDMKKFLMHLAKRDLPFICHDVEGPDDSPSHMKSLLLQSSLMFIVENKKIVHGTWQGIFLAEFRDAPKKRKILVKFLADR